MAYKRFRRRHWDLDEMRFLEANYLTMSDEKIAQKLNRPLSGVQNKRKIMGLHRPKVEHDRAHYERHEALRRALVTRRWKHEADFRSA